MGFGGPLAAPKSVFAIPGKASRARCPVSGAPSRGGPGCALSGSVARQGGAALVSAAAGA